MALPHATGIIGPAMPFLIYFVVLLIAGASVLFGLDWLSSPMSPMAPIKPAIQAAKVPPPARTVATTVSPAPPQPEPQRETATTVAPVTAPAVVTPVASVSVPVVADEAEPANAAAATTTLPQIAVEEKQQAKCDVNACTSAYRSFIAEDCTYQPSVGPRRLCTKGTPPNDTAGAPDAAAASRADANTTGAQCNVSACAAAYGSFSAADCTYQPFDGPRRLCEK